MYVEEMQHLPLAKLTEHNHCFQICFANRREGVKTSYNLKPHPETEETYSKYLRNRKTPNKESLKNMRAGIEPKVCEEDQQERLMKGEEP